MHLHGRGDWDFWNIPTSVIIDVRSSLQVDFPLILEKCDKSSINRPSSAEDEFLMGLLGLKTLDRKLQLLSYVDGLCADVRYPVGHEQSLARQAGPHPADLALVRSDMTRQKSLLRLLSIIWPMFSRLYLLRRVSATSMAVVLVSRRSGMLFCRRFIAVFVFV